MKPSAFKQIQTVAFCKNDIIELFNKITDCIKRGGKIFFCSDGRNTLLVKEIQADFRKGFSRHPMFFGKRLTAFLPTMPRESMIVDSFETYCKNISSVVKSGDVVLFITTFESKQERIVSASKICKTQGAVLLLLTNIYGNKLRDVFDACISVPAVDTKEVKELQRYISHALRKAIQSFDFKQ